MRFGSNGRLAIAATTLATFGTTAATLRAAATPVATVTVADIQKELADGDNAAAIAGSSRLLSASGPAASGVDKAAVYAVKAQAHMNLKQFSQAGDAYTRGAKVSTDPLVVATDTAMALLIKKSHNGAYLPKQAGSDGAKPTPVDISSGTDQKTALADLFTDEFAADAAKLKAATTSTSIPVIQSAADTAALLRDVEIAATGGDEKSKPEIDAIVSHAHDLLAQPMDGMTQQVEKIKTAADAAPSYARRTRTGGATGGNANGGGAGGGGGAGAGGAAGGGNDNNTSQVKVGLTQQQRSDLQNIIANAQKIVTAAKALAKSTDEPKGLTSKTSSASAGDSTATTDGGGTAAATGGDNSGGTAASTGGDGGSPLDTLVTDAEKLGNDANDVLNANYGHPGSMASSGYGNYRGARAR